MEPLSAVASVIALTQAIEKLLKAAKLAKSVGQIPREYLELVEELELNRALAQEVTEHIRYQNGGDWQMLRDISSRLNGGVKSLEQITDMVVKKPSRSSQNGRNEGVTVISTFRWQMNKHEIAKTREQFRQIKGSLQLCLQLLMSTQSALAMQRDLTMQQTLFAIQESIAQQSKTHQLEAPLSPETTQATVSAPLYRPFPEDLGSHCDPFCLCCCHEVSASRPLAWVEPLLGKLVIDTNMSLIFSRKACDSSICKVRSPPAAKIRYTYPQWSVQRVFEACMSFGALSGPGVTLHLRVPRVIGGRVFGLIRSGNIPLLKEMLLSKTLMPADVDEAGMPLMRYISTVPRQSKRNSQMYRMLLKSGFDLGIKDPYGISSVIYARAALRVGWCSMKPELVTAYQHVAYGNSMAHYEPIRLNKVHQAFFAGDEDILDFVLKSCGQQDVDFRDECGLAPIHYAVYCGRLRALQLLIDAGADLELRRLYSSQTTIRMATHPKIVPEVMELLLKGGVDPNIKGYRHTAILHTLGQPAKMRMLLKKGAHPIVPESDWETPLHFWFGPYISPHYNQATEASIEECVRMLQKEGVDINHRDSRGRTPFMMAVARCETPTMRVLIRLKARVDGMTKKGRNILHFAASTRDAKVFKTLKTVDLSALDPDQCDDMGFRPQDFGLDYSHCEFKKYTQQEVVSFLDELRNARLAKLTAGDDQEEECE